MVDEHASTDEQDAGEGAAGGRRFRAVVCDSDLLEAAALRAAAEAAGFEVLAEAVNAVEALRLVEQFGADAVIIVNELVGMTGLEAIRDLHAMEGGPPVVLVSTRWDELQTEALEAGAFAVVPRHDLPATEEAARQVHEFLVTGNRRSGADRRSGRDRRQHQDWSKVTRERRSGTDRRQGPRRT